MAPETLSYNQAPDRLPPHNLEAEAAVLGACMMDPAALDVSLEMLAEEDFFKGAHRLVFRACKELSDRSQPVDLITIQDRLAAQGQLEGAGGPMGLAGLSEKVASATNVESYAKLVADKAKLRRLITVCAKTTQDAYQRQEEASLVIDSAENAVLEVGRESDNHKAKPIQEMIMSVIATVEAYGKRGGAVSGLATGFTKLDELTSGMHPGQMIVVAGRPGSGKTALALNIAQHVALEQKKPVAIFSLEMTNEELLFRLLCSEGRVNSQHLRTGRTTPQEMGNLTRAASRMYTAPMYINDAGDLNIQTLKASVRRLVKEKKVALVVVDYLQLLSVEGKVENRVQEVTQISKQLKAIAKEMRVPVLVASQLNRGVEQRQGSKTEGLPRLSDLRESGSIEQDADVVMLLHRKKKADDDMSPEPDNSAKLIVAKQRSGPTDDIDLVFLGEYTRFENAAPAYQAGP